MPLSHTFRDTISPWFAVASIPMSEVYTLAHTGRQCQTGVVSDEGRTDKPDAAQSVKWMARESHHLPQDQWKSKPGSSSGQPSVTSVKGSTYSSASVNTVMSCL